MPMSWQMKRFECLIDRTVGIRERAAEAAAAAQIDGKVR